MRGAEALMFGTDAWAQVVSDHARPRGCIEPERRGERTRGREKGTKEKAKKISQDKK